MTRKFYCNNFGYKSVEIPYSRVNDGVCDCCDGSDEQSSAKKCENTCQELGQNYRKLRQETQKILENGRKKKIDYIEFGKSATFDDSDKLLKSEAEVREKEVEIDRLQESLSSLEQKREVDEVTKAEARIKSLKLQDLPRDELEFMLVLLADYSGLGMKLEHMVRDALEEYKSGKDAANDRVSEDNYEDYYDAYGEGEDNVYWIDDDEVCEALLDQGDYQEDSEDGEKKLICSEGSSSNKGEIQKIRREIEKLEKEKRRLKRSKSSRSKEAKKDFGPENVFYKLNEKCFEKKIMQYKYSICLYGQAKQDKTNLGRYSSLDISENGEMSMMFDKGTRCHNSVTRSMKVTFKCGETEKIGEIKEPSMCAYQAEFYTPAAC